MPLDDHLAAHLSLFRNCCSEIDRDLTKLETYFNTYKMTGKIFLKKEEFDSYSGLILRNFERAVQHAIWAAFLLDKLVLRRWALFHRLFRKWRKPKDEKASRELLEKGSGKKEVI
jgi:hypothetical protein